MFFDLNVPIVSPSPTNGQSHSKKAKSKHQGANVTGVSALPDVVYTAAHVAAVEARVELLVQLGYSVIAFNQTETSKVEPRIHVNILDPLLLLLKKRQGVIFLKRLTIVLDEDSEKGFGLTNANAALFTPYDIIALQPTTQSTLSLACLTHTQPSPLTAHLISLPLTLPRLPFRLKHTFVRTALRYGAAFEIAYSGAVSGGGEAERRNWWAAASEVVRATKGKGIIVSSGVSSDAELRAPRDIANLITLLNLPQNLAHDASTKTPKSLVLRAQTRKTYRAILSEPRLVIPSTQNTSVPEVAQPTPTTHNQSTPIEREASRKEHPSENDTHPNSVTSIIPTIVPVSETAKPGSARKRPLEDDQAPVGAPDGEGQRKKKKRKKREGGKNKTDD